MPLSFINQVVSAVLMSILFSPSLQALALMPDETSTITLDQTVHFIGPDGSDVVAKQGDYSVEKAQKWLRLIPGTGRRDALLIEAQSETHEVKVEIPIVISTPGTEPDESNIYVVQLLNPDGTSLVAIGTYSGIQSRGLRDRARQAAARARAAAEAARRAAAQKAEAARAAALQAKQAAEQAAREAAANVHDRLFGAAPPASLGPNAFNTAFNENAVGYAPSNAYLLTYLTTLIYPEFLDQLSGDPLTADIAYVTRLHKTPQDFVQEFARYTHHLFWNSALEPGPANHPPQYVWIWGNRGGQDPEAMVIAMPNIVFVVFRGTDRVAQAKKKVGYDWAEWIQTDFVALGIPPQVRPLGGLVHAGFWGSLTAPASLFVPSNSQVPGGISNGLPFRDALLAVIKAFGGDQKKVWMVGHSLGAAHVQLYAAYLTVNNLSPQGVYAIAAPHVGDQTFVNQLNRMFPNNRLQRFDFVHDPVTKVPPNAPLPQPDRSFITYARAGTRVYYHDVTTVQFGAPERSPSEGARIAGLLVGGGALGGIFAAGDFCYHYPQWYLNAAYNQLNQATGSRVPSPLPTPVMRGNIYSLFCGPLQVTRGNRSAGSVTEGLLPGR